MVYITTMSCPADAKYPDAKRVSVAELVGALSEKDANELLSLLQKDRQVSQTQQSSSLTTSTPTIVPSLQASQSPKFGAEIVSSILTELEQDINRMRSTNGSISTETIVCSGLRLPCVPARAQRTIQVLRKLDGKSQ